MKNPYKANDSQLKQEKTRKLAPTTRMVSAIAISVSALIATLIRIASPEYPFFGPDQYVMQATPYLFLILLTILFRRTMGGATISLVGAVILGGFGVYTIYSAGGEIDSISLTPFLLAAGSGFLLLFQLIRKGMQMPN